MGRLRVFSVVGVVASLALLPGGGAAQVRIAATSETPAATKSAETKSLGSSSGPIRGPVLGYVFEERGQALRPVLGLPGAAYVGGALPIDFTARFADVSPRQDYALAADANGSLRLVDLQGELPIPRALPAVTLSADRVVFSPRGSAAAVYQRQGRLVQILSGLPDSPSANSQVDLTALPGVVTAIAVTDDGGTLLVAFSERQTGSVYAVRRGQDPRLVTPVGRVSSIAFLESSGDALAADYDRNEILRIEDAGGAARVNIVASQRDGVTHPVAVAASQDGRQAFAASAETRSVLAIPLAGGAIISLPCNCSPTLLAPLRGASVFRLTAASSSPLYLLDAGPGPGAAAKAPRILFVPAADRPEPAALEAAAPINTGRVRR